MTQNEIHYKKKIYQLKRKLNESNELVLMYVEGAITKEEFEEVKIQRELWRTEIKALETILTRSKG